MPRQSDLLIGEKAYGERALSPMTDLNKGGQFGFLTSIKDYLSSAPYTSRPLVVKVLEGPEAFKFLPEPDKWYEAIKALFELHPLRVEGYNAKLTVETAETNFGGAGEVQQTPTNVTRARSEPSFTWVDKMGRPITNIHEFWITELIMDPETKTPGLLSRPGIREQVKDWLPDMYSMSILVFEPDASFTKIEKAWLSVNMFPMESPDITGTRDLSQAGEQNEATIPYTAITSYGLGVRLLAQKFLDEINLTNANPALRPAYVDDVTADIKRGEHGYRENIEAAGAAAVTP